MTASFHKTKIFPKNFSNRFSKGSFLKKQTLLESILFQYLEWRETLLFQNPNKKFEKGNEFQNFDENQNFNWHQNFNFQQLSTKMASEKLVYQKLTLPKSASYWLFPLVGLVGLTKSHSEVPATVNSTISKTNYLVSQQPLESEGLTKKVVPISYSGQLSPAFSSLNQNFLKKSSFKIEWENFEGMSSNTETLFLRKLNPIFQPLNHSSGIFSKQTFLPQPTQSYIASSLLLNEFLEQRLQQNETVDLKKRAEPFSLTSATNLQIPDIYSKELGLTEDFTAFKKGPSVLSNKFIKILRESQNGNAQPFAPTTWNKSLKQELLTQLSKVLSSTPGDNSLKNTKKSQAFEWNTPLLQSNITQAETPLLTNVGKTNLETIGGFDVSYALQSQTPAYEPHFNQLKTIDEFKYRLKKGVNSFRNSRNFSENHGGWKDQIFHYEKNLGVIRKKLLSILFTNWSEEKTTDFFSDLPFNGVSLTQNDENRSRFMLSKSRTVEKVLRSYLSLKKRKTTNVKSVFMSSKLKNYQNFLKRTLKNNTSVFNTVSPTRKKEDSRSSRKFLSLYQKHPYNYLNKKSLIFLRNSETNIVTSEKVSTLDKPMDVNTQKTLEFNSEFVRLQKLKNQQKSRKRKKQRRETRRRKKRKRIYPRPLWIRAHFYKKFLKTRHEPNIALKLSTKKVKDSKELFQSQISRGLLQIFPQKIYNRTQFLAFQKFQRAYQMEKTIPVFAENRFYYIPKFLLSDFQRSILKSYWLKSNLKPYLLRIQKTLDTIRLAEKERYSFKPLLNEFFPLAPTKSSPFPLAPSFDATQSVTPIGNSGIFEKRIQNISTYNRFLYQRILGLIKNIKGNIGANGNFRARPASIGRKRHDELNSKSVWELFNQFLNFEFFSKQMPTATLDETYRDYWSLNKTNVFGFKENNTASRLWSLTKYRDQKKANQTKRLLSLLKRSLSFEKNSKNLLEKSKLYTAERKLFLLMSPNLKESTTFLKSDKKIQQISFNHAKSRLYFWWNCLPTNSSIQQTPLNAALPTHFVESDSDSQTSTLLWNVCLLTIHFGILFSVLQISTVRSFLKVVFLVSTKFVMSYTSVLNWIFERSKISQKKGAFVFESLKTFSEPSFVNSLSQSQALNNSALTNFQKSNRFQFFIKANPPITVNQTATSEKPHLVFNQKGFLALNWRLFAITKMGATKMYSIQKFTGTIGTKFVEMFEGLMAFVYQFLEKPAEFMVDWLGQLFLIESAAHLSTYTPESLENNLWKTFVKFSRQANVLGLAGIPIQSYFLNQTSELLNSLLKSDMDLIMRQKKSQIFWEIWSEILVRAVSKYNMNLSSLTTIKDEQDRLFENLLQDPDWDWSTASFEKLTPYLQFRNLQTTQSFFLKEKRLTPDFWISSGNFNQKAVFGGKNSLSLTSSGNQKQWDLYQSVTLQTRESDLFLDFSPPSGLKSVRALNSAFSVQQNLGQYICEMYSQLFVKKVAKNLLVIGPPGREKSLLIQALAGEAELKLITDNANRYAIVQRGVAIGMKLLRDVFEGLAFNAPCIFLIEDIHAIGEKRSFLISEDQITSTDASLGAEREEIHERNQMIAQLTRHMIMHYKKPYKGDFSMSIPTNRFDFQLFLGVIPPRTRRSNLALENPLDLSATRTHKIERLRSILQLAKREKFAPPTTSPFSLLVLRENKKFKPLKRVQEVSWFGQSMEGASSENKSASSVRVKVAMLADLALSNLSAKLDMITELLVIIDSVRSNHGFLVFATTHMPYKLDPALRRPGRLDETLNLALRPNFKDRLELMKGVFSSANFTTLSNMDTLRHSGYLSLEFANPFFSQSSLKRGQFSNLSGLDASASMRTFNFFDYAIQLEQTSEIGIQEMAIKAKTLLTRKNLNAFGQPESKEKYRASFDHPAIEKQVENLLSFDFHQIFKKSKRKDLASIKPSMREDAYKFLRSALMNLQSLIYYKTIEVCSNLWIEQNMKAYTLHFVRSFGPLATNLDTYKSLYAPMWEVDQKMSSLFSSSTAQFFYFSGICRYLELSNSKTGQSVPHYFGNHLIANHISPTNGTTLLPFENLKKNSSQEFFATVFYKRRFYQQTTLILDFLSFSQPTALKEPPGPSTTAILKPLKRYENFKRFHEDFAYKMQMSIQEKIQLHQQQRFLKALYQKPIQALFQNLSGNGTQGVGFNNALRDLGYNDSKLLKPSSVNSYYRNRILNRHRYYYTNQWWTGALPEHTLESTFSSDIDWRSSFFEISKSQNFEANQKQNPGQQDILIDFPDPEQYYNPRNRRWVLTKGLWANWENLVTPKTAPDSSFFTALVLNKFQKTLTTLSYHREQLDYFSYLFLRYGNLQELDLLQKKYLN